MNIGTRSSSKSALGNSSQDCLQFGLPSLQLSLPAPQYRRSSAVRPAHRVVRSCVSLALRKDADCVVFPRGHRRALSSYHPRIKFPGCAAAQSPLCAPIISRLRTHIHSRYPPKYECEFRILFHFRPRYMLAAVWVEYGHYLRMIMHRWPTSDGCMGPKV